MSWNLTWNLIESNESEFVVLLNDEPIARKTLHANVYLNKSQKYLTFAETSYVFKFDNFSNFINMLENDQSCDFYFDVYDGYDKFEYDKNTSKLIFHWSMYSQSLIVSIPIDDRSRVQFASQFKNFLEYSKKFLEEN